MTETSRDKLYRVLSVAGLCGLVLYVLFSQFIAPKKVAQGKTNDDVVRLKSDPSPEPNESEESPKDKITPTYKDELTPEPETKDSVKEGVEANNVKPPAEPVATETNKTDGLPAKEEDHRVRTLDNLNALDLDFIEGFSHENKKKFLLYRSQLGRSMTWDDVLQVPGLSPVAVENLRRWLDGE